VLIISTPSQAYAINLSADNSIAFLMRGRGSINASGPRGHGQCMEQYPVPMLNGGDAGAAAGARRGRDRCATGDKGAADSSKSRRASNSPTALVTHVAATTRARSPERDGDGREIHGIK
jgi:hypothetical protein